MRTCPKSRNQECGAALHGGQMGHLCRTRRKIGLQCWRWQASLQYLVWHLIHRGAVWASGAAQAAQFVRIILRFAVSYWACVVDSA